MTRLTIQGADGRRRIRLNLPHDEIVRRLKEALTDDYNDDPFDNADGAYASVEGSRVTVVVFGTSRERVLAQANRILGIMRRATP